MRRNTEKVQRTKSAPETDKAGPKTPTSVSEDYMDEKQKLFQAKQLARRQTTLTKGIALNDIKENSDDGSSSSGRVKLHLNKTSSRGEFLDKI